jgi:hypothetical protein
VVEGVEVLPGSWMFSLETLLERVVSGSRIQPFGKSSDGCSRS